MAYTIFAIFSICSLAALAGVMLSIGYILGPYWTTLEAKNFLDCFEKTGSCILAVLPYVIIPSVIGLTACTWLSWKENTQEKYFWVVSILCLFVTMAVTKVWFFSENERFLSGKVQIADLPQRLRFWLQLHNLRIGLLFIAAAAAVRATLLGSLLR